MRYINTFKAYCSLREVFEEKEAKTIASAIQNAFDGNISDVYPTLCEAFEEKKAKALALAIKIACEKDKAKNVQKE